MVAVLTAPFAALLYFMGLSKLPVLYASRGVLVSACVHASCKRRC